MGYMHEIELESGVKGKYSLFYKYDNFVNKLRSCNYLFDKTVNYQNVEGQEHLTFGAEFTQKWKNNNMLNSMTEKFVIDSKGVKVSKVTSFKGYGDIFDELKFSIKAHVKLFLIF
jgi:hypothetical protein